MSKRKRNSSSKKNNTGTAKRGNGGPGKKLQESDSVFEDETYYPRTNKIKCKNCDRSVTWRDVQTECKHLKNCSGLPLSKRQQYARRVRMHKEAKIQKNTSQVRRSNLIDQNLQHTFSQIQNQHGSEARLQLLATPSSK